MKKERANNVVTINEGIGAASGIFASVHPVFSLIPLIVFGINRIIGYVSNENVIKRLNQLEKKLQKKKISIEEFKDKISQLTEHNEYIVRNNLNNILLNCIPETMDIYIDTLIDLIMKQENSIYEELCEIINQLNKNDVTLLRMIDKYKKTGSRKYFELHLDNDKKKAEEYKKIDEENAKIREYNNTTSGYKRFELTKWVDRNIKIGENTIFWKDFAETYELSTPEMGLALLYETINDENKLSMDWAYLIRSFIKLEKLGVIQLDYINTVGTINSLNVERFHITLFGLKLLNYI